MLLNLNGNYFSWNPDRIADVIVSLDAAKPFIDYPGFTRVESNGRNVCVSLDGRSLMLPNHELSALLTNVQKELASASPSTDSSPSP